MSVASFKKVSRQTSGAEILRAKLLIFRHITPHGFLFFVFLVESGRLVFR
jgi:hypothetical protein